MKREVEVTGDQADLIMLTNSFNDPSMSISETNNKFILRSTEFELLKTSSAVRNKSEEVVTALSGATHLLLDAHKPIEVGAIFSLKDDGKRDAFIFPEPVVLRFRGELSMLVKRADGTVETHYPSDSAPRWVKLALKDEVVARALRLRNTDGLEWVDLYRLFEVIESNVSVKNMETKSWVTVNQIQRFKRTANSQKTIGDKARHGKDSNQPPKKPMLFSEAKELIDFIMKSWLQEKAGQAFAQTASPIN